MNVVLSFQCHYSVAKAAAFLGIGTKNVYVVPADQRFLTTMLTRTMNKNNNNNNNSYSNITIVCCMRLFIESSISIFSKGENDFKGAGEADPNSDK